MVKTVVDPMQQDKDYNPTVFEHGLETMAVDPPLFYQIMRHDSNPMVYSITYLCSYPNY